MSTQLLIYETAVPVSPARHSKCSVEVKDYSFARNVNAVPIVAAEFPFAAAEYTIVFAGTAEDIMPAVILGVRPEHVAVGHVAGGHVAGGSGVAGSGGAGAAAKVEIDEPMGSDSLLWLRFAGQALSARAPAEHGFRAGDAVGLRFDISKASLFDTETEQRL